MGKLIVPIPAETLMNEVDDAIVDGAAIILSEKGFPESYVHTYVNIAMSQEDQELVADQRIYTWEGTEFMTGKGFVFARLNEPDFDVNATIDFDDEDSIRDAVDGWHRRTMAALAGRR